MKKIRPRDPVDLYKVYSHTVHSVQCAVHRLAGLEPASSWSPELEMERRDSKLFKKQTKFFFPEVRTFEWLTTSERNNLHFL